MATPNALGYSTNRTTYRTALQIILVCTPSLFFSCHPDAQKKPAKYVPYPTQVHGLTSGFVDVAIGGGSWCALNENGEVYCWGTAIDSANQHAPTPVKIEIPPIKALMGGNQLVMVTQDGESAFHVNVGHLFEYEAPTTRFAEVTNDADARAAHCLFLKDGSLRCDSVWTHYQVPITFGPTNVRQTAGLAVFDGGRPLDWGVSILTDGEIVCARVQQCGQPSSRNFDLPAYYGSGPTLPGAPKAKYVSHGCLVGADGLVYCWGENGWGQLGTGLTSWFDGTWRPALHIRDAVRVETQLTHSCALTKNGELWCWGANSTGQLGIGYVSTGGCPVEAQADYMPPDDDPGHFTCGFGEFEPRHVLNNVRDFAISPINTCAVLTNGSVKCWGSQNGGALGNGVLSTE